MSDDLTNRLNAILPRVVADDFLSSSGIGNEIAFYVFAYAPEDEIRVREHIRFLLNHIPKQKPGLRVKHINLFDLVVDHLKARKKLDACFKMQREKGDDHLLKNLRPILDAEKIANVFAEAAEPDQHDLVLVSGVGSVWPVVRTHNLLNNLHSRMGKTPLVMFYPGQYDGQFLRLFGKIKPDAAFAAVKGKPYYRAFELVPRGGKC
jgi:hypothetical protein